MIASVTSCVSIELQAPPLLVDNAVLRLDQQARDYRQQTGALPVWGTDLPADAVERLRPLPQGLRLNFVCFHEAPDGGVITEWRPPGKRDEWMWARVDGTELLSQLGEYRGGAAK